MSDNSPIWVVAKFTPDAAAIYAPSLVAFFSYTFMVYKKWLRLDASLPIFGAVLGAFLFACMYLRGLPVLGAVTAALVTAILAQGLANASTLKQRMAIWVMNTPVLYIACATLIMKAIPASEISTQYGSNLTQSKSTYQCIGPNELNQIQKLPKGTMIAPFFQTEFLVRNTKLNLAFGGYHRAYKRNIEIIKALISKPELARREFSKNGVSYLSVCLISGQFSLMSRENPDSLIAAVATNNAPSWLKPIIPLQDGGMVYQVVD
jgi:hypothetical protein